MKKTIFHFVLFSLIRTFARENMKRTSWWLLTAAILISMSAKADNITFADANVKALCVANWDTNKDGELSTEEAAAVTSLGTVFKEQTNITTFNEFKYFTGLTVIGERAFYKSSIQSITFPSSLTDIAMYAFYKSEITGELIVPGNVKTIKAYAFLECTQLTRVILQEGVEDIGTEAFNGPIHYLSLPTTITSYGWDGVNPYMSHGFEDRDYEFHLFARSKTPVPVNDYAFHCLYGEGILVVPFGCVDTYESTLPWNVFYKILEIGDVNEDGALDNTDLQTIKSYVDGLPNIALNTDIADINGDGTVDITDWELLNQHLNPILMGDVNGDGAVNVLDVTTLVSYVLNEPLETFVEAAADVNGDGNINTLDVTKLVSIILE